MQTRAKLKEVIPVNVDFNTFILLIISVQLALTYVKLAKK